MGLKKLFTIVVSFLLVAVQAGPASADLRMTLNTDKIVVVEGSTATFSLTEAVNERYSYSWQSLKYEVMQTVGSKSQLSFATSQSPAATCNGSLTGSSSTVRNCAGFVPAAARTVIPAGIDASYLSQSKLALTNFNSVEFAVGVRVWLDLDGNDEVSVFEPSSRILSIEFINVESFSAFIDFRADPPLNNEGVTSAWLTAAGGFDSSGQNLLSAIDASKLQLWTYVCIEFCDLAKFDPTFRSHPQLQAYEFKATGLSGGKDTYAFRLRYENFPGNSVTLAEVNFDYSLRNTNRFTTAASGASMQSYSYVGAPKSEAQEQWSQLPLESATVSYAAVLYDSQGLPLRNKKVNIRVDASQVANSEFLEIDGRRSGLTAESDQVWIERTTDTNGKVALVVSNKLPANFDSVMIEIQADGWRSWEVKVPSPSKRIFWISKPKTSIEVSGSFNKSTGYFLARIRIPIEANVFPLISQVTVPVLISTPKDIRPEYSVLKLTDYESSVNAKTKVRTSYLSQTIKIRVASQANTSGNGNLTLRTISNGKWISKNVKIYWRGSDGLISLSPIK